MTDEPVRLECGVVAFDDGSRVAAALRSLTGQQLPANVRLDRIVCVAGGRTPETVAAARVVAEEDPRIVLIEETERRGKAAALAEICQQTQGDLLVLMNGDARALPGSLARLVERAGRARTSHFGVMARPVPPLAPGSVLDGPTATLWRLHHEMHAEMARDRCLQHLSDELLLLPARHLPPFEPGIVNDGSFAAGWIRSNGGELFYAEDALVEVAPPAGPRDHILQRRRILHGHRQAGRNPGFGRFAVQHPGLAMRMLRRAAGGLSAWRDLTILAALESAAVALGGWDRLVRRDYGVWPRIETVPAAEPETSPRYATGG